MNEETLKAKLILPFLRSQGMEVDSVELERTFTIQLGHGVYRVNGEEAAAATGRLDLLCTADGQNLFVVELKRPELPLTEDDSRQGLSYARLLHPMPPYVLLSNGRESRILDTRSGKDIAGKGARGTYVPDVGDELALRFEALQYFVGYSAANLQVFCNSHNEENLRPFRTTSNAHGKSRVPKKYDPEAYVTRDSIESAFARFLDQNQFAVFPVVGDSGTGKTNVLCHIVDKGIAGPSLFYSGTFLGGSFLQQLALDFNLAFSAESESVGVLRKVTSLGRREGWSFTIVFDAVDEWDAPDKVAQLCSLSTVLASLGLRLVVSCKTQAWPRFLTLRGVSTPFALSLFADVPSLGPYSELESSVAAQLYSKVWDVALVSSTLPPATTNPLALRLAFEEARAAGRPVNLTKPSRAMIASFLDSRAVAAGDSAGWSTVLREVGRRLLDADRHQVEESVVASALGIGAVEGLPSEYFEFDILVRSVWADGSVLVGFYFGLVRDHVVSMSVLRLSSRPLMLEEPAARALLGTNIGESALGYFFRTGDALEQRFSLDLIIERDSDGKRGLLARLLAWEGRHVRDDVLASRSQGVLRHLASCFASNLDDSVLARQVVDAIGLVGGPESDGTLVELLELLAQRGEVGAQSTCSRVAALLASNADSEILARLVKLASDPQGDGYVRRYVVEALSSRDFAGKQQLFLELLQGESANVRWWVRGWYALVETTGLRDALVDILVEGVRLGVGKDVVCALGQSVLPDTAELLWRRLSAYRLPAGVVQWGWRALAWLGYEDAVPLWVGTVRSDPASEYAGQALLAIGEMKAASAKPAVAELVWVDDAVVGSNGCWVGHAFRQLATESDYDELGERLGGAGLTPSSVRALTLLAESGIRRWDGLVVRTLMSDVLPDGSRREVMGRWLDALAFRSAGGRDRLGRELGDDDAAVVLETGVIDDLLALFAANGCVAMLALTGLVNSNADLGRVVEHVERYFEDMTEEWENRLTVLFNRSRWLALGQRLRPWLHRRLATMGPGTLRVRGWLGFLEMVADLSTLDVVNSDRARYDALFGRQNVEALEDLVRRGVVPCRHGDFR